MTYRVLHTGYSTPKVDGDPALVPRGLADRSCKCADGQKGSESSGWSYKRRWTRLCMPNTVTKKGQLGRSWVRAPLRTMQGTRQDSDVHRLLG